MILKHLAVAENTGIFFEKMVDVVDLVDVVDVSKNL